MRAVAGSVSEPTVTGRFSQPRRMAYAITRPLPAGMDPLLLVGSRAWKPFFGTETRHAALRAFLAAVSDGGANAAVLTELGGLGASLVAALLVIVRVDSVLFEYVGAASAARLERIGEKEEGRGAA